MRLIAERLLPDAVPGSVYVQGEAGSQVLSAPSLTHGRKHHLYCSMHNIGAAQVVADLSKLLSEKRRRISRLPWRAQLLHATENFAELDGCELMLLYLTRDTWTSGEVSAWLAREVCEAMRLGVPLLLVRCARAPRGDSCDGAGDGWDVLAPAGWGGPLWGALVMAGAHAVGLDRRDGLAHVDHLDQRVEHRWVGLEGADGRALALQAARGAPRRA